MEKKEVKREGKEENNKEEKKQEKKPEQEGLRQDLKGEKAVRLVAFLVWYLLSIPVLYLLSPLRFLHPLLRNHFHVNNGSLPLDIVLRLHVSHFYFSKDLTHAECRIVSLFFWPESQSSWSHTIRLPIPRHPSSCQITCPI